MIFPTSIVKDEIFDILSGRWCAFKGALFDGYIDINEGFVEYISNFTPTENVLIA